MASLGRHLARDFEDDGGDCVQKKRTGGQICAEGRPEAAT